VTLNVILDQVVNQLRVDAADILLMRPHTQLLELAASRGFRTDQRERSPERLGESHAGRVAADKTIVHVADLRQEERTVFPDSILALEGFVAYWGVPLIAKGRVNGVLELFHRQPLTTDGGWMSFLQALAGQAAIAIDNAGLFDGLERANAELTRAYDATLESLGKAVELRDRQTAGHCDRVTDLTVEIAKAMGVSDERLVHCRRGAMLHDIGKLAVPDSVLLKPGPLTEEEWEVMRRHCELGHQMLSRIPYLRPALAIPLSHHEKWDGSGYPHGLKEHEIPLEARVFAVVDVWDALRSHRSYREAWSENVVTTFFEIVGGGSVDGVLGQP